MRLKQNIATQTDLKILFISGLSSKIICVSCGKTVPSNTVTTTMHVIIMMVFKNICSFALLVCLAGRVLQRDPLVTDVGR